MNDINTAIDYFHSNEFEKAEKIALKIYEQNPNNNDVIDILAAVFLKTNKSCLVDFQNKKYIDVIRKTAIYLNKLKMYHHSMELYKKSLKLEPKDAVGLNNLGLLYENLQDDNNAKICYEKSLKIRPNYEAFYNLGIYYRKQKDAQNAIKYVKKALDFKPNDSQTEYSLGMLYFMESNFQEGYKHFLKRYTPGIETLKNFWDGQPKPDKTILVFCDYGLGDAIMFSRYFPFLKNYFKKIKVYCSKNLKPLFEESFNEIEFSCNLSEITYDYCVLAMNLPYYLNMDFSNIPYPNGYLRAEDTKIKEYKEKYFKTDKLKVGLFWIGGGREKRTEKYRAIPLQKFEKILNKDKYKFYSFQIEDPFFEIKNFPQITNLGTSFRNFSDTAAAMKNLDLMISIDSSLIHLAGALNIKSYLLLPKCSEWRWFKDEKETPWYNSVEIFAQKNLYDWSFVTNKLYDTLYGINP